MLAVIAVQHERVVLLVKDNGQDGADHFWRNGLLLGALDTKDDMADAVVGQKCLEFMILLIFLNQRPVPRSAV
jgi:hypothetical protein